MVCDIFGLQYKILNSNFILQHILGGITLKKTDVLRHEKEIERINEQLNYKLWFGTIEEFNALATIDSNTIYLIKE